MSQASTAIFLGVIAGISGMILSLTPPGFRLEEDAGLELLFKLRGSRKPPPEVIVVAIDKASAEKLDVDVLPHKWPRSLHARLLDTLTRAGASVIVFDMFFSQARSADNDLLFAEAIAEAGNVVLGSYLKQEVLIDDKGQAIDNIHLESHVSPIPAFARSAAAVATFPLPKYPHRVNQYWTFKTAARESPSLPVAAFQIFASPSSKEFLSLIESAAPQLYDEIQKIGTSAYDSGNIVPMMKGIRAAFKKEPALAQKIRNRMSQAHAPPSASGSLPVLISLLRMYQSPSTLYLNFYGPPRTIATVPYYQVLQSAEESLNIPEQPDFSGKAVFVGLSENIPSERRNDSFFTVYSQENGIDISGVEIAATAFANLLEDRHLRTPGIPGRAAVIFLWGLLLGFVLQRLIPPALSLKEMLLPVAAVSAMTILYFLFVRYHFNTSGIWYPVVVPLLLVPFTFFGAILMRNIRTERTGYGIYLFTDIKGFTTFSEKKDPEELKKLMHTYFKPLSRIVERHGGVMEAAPGDAMLARWEVSGSGDSSRKVRDKACRAAIEISKKAFTFLPSSHEKLHTRIGLHAGYTSRGSIGSKHQRKNITFGDPVNTVERIEELNKSLGTQILVSEEVLEQLDAFLTRKAGKFILAGKSTPVAVHELLCLMKDASPGKKQLCVLFSEALQAFERQSWAESADKFHEIIQTFGQDGPSLYYADLCERYRKRTSEGAREGIVCRENR